MPSFPSLSPRPRPPQGPNLFAAGLVIASSVGFGAAMGTVARENPDWRVQPDPVPLEPDFGRDLIASVLVLGLGFASAHAFSRWGNAYASGPAMSLEELERSYE